jgi:hypothetical protein
MEEDVIKIKKGTLVLIVVALIFVGTLSFVIWDLSPSDEVVVEESLGDESDRALVGSDRDEHGCIPSAGYTWCEDKGKCLRIWEEECSSISLLTYESCIDNTEDGPECKDCCDCLDSDSTERTACRDECATHDFSENSYFVVVSAPSVLGLDGDYSECVDEGEERECKICCEESMDLQCGDYRHCRTACNEAFE